MQGEAPTTCDGLSIFTFGCYVDVHIIVILQIVKVLHGHLLNLTLDRWIMKHMWTCAKSYIEYILGEIRLYK